MSTEEPLFRIQVLGQFAVEVNGRTVIDRGWSRRKAQAVIKLLALRRNHAAHREEVLDLLWPELEPSAALNNLYKNLHHIRAALSKRDVGASLVTLNGEMVELASKTVVDVDVFRRLAREAMASLDVAALREAAEVYRGDLLPEDTYEEWTESGREELRSIYIELMFGLSRALDGDGEHAESIEVLQLLLQADPLNEDAHRLLIGRYAQAGSRHRALRQFQTLTDLLRSELGAEPSQETRALYESLSTTPADAREGTAEGPVTPEPVRRPRRITPVFGRESELETVQELMDNALEGEGGSLLVWGEAGVGKSHFVNQLLADAEDGDFLTAVSRCSELESSSAYQPFRDVLRQVGSGPGAEDVIRHSPYLRRVLYGATERDEQTADPTLFQTELFNDAYRLIGRVSQARPVVICLDDFHEADEDSVRLFHFLARRASSLRALLVASSRIEGRERSAVASPVASLRRDHQLVELELGPLDDQAMTLFVEGQFGEVRPDAALLREVLEAAEGNPLFAAEMVQTLKQEGWARLVDGRWTRRGQRQAIIPTAVKDLVDIRLRHLSHAAQEQVQLAAVYGREIDYPLLRRTLGIPERDALDALDECIEANIIEETPEGYRFRHELLREGIYERLTRLRRQSLHKSIAEALAARWPDPVQSPQVEMISHHFALSDEPWLAVPYLMESGRRAASVFANEQAVSFYEQVIALTEAYPNELPEVDPGSVMESLGDVERRRANTQRSVELFERAYEVFARAGMSEAASRVRGKAALGHIMLGESEVARDQISATLQDLTEASPQHVVSRTYYLLAQLHWHGGDHRQALEAAERALIAASESQDPGEKAQAFEVMALACHSLGDWQRGVELELERQSLGVPGFNTDEAFEAHL